MDKKTRLKILQNIFENFQQISQWEFNWINYSLESTYKAKSLIELLEVEDCQSISGYDPTNKVINLYNNSIYNRFVALINKYHKNDDIKACCGFTVESLGIYFKKVSNLRFKILSNK